MSEFFLELFSEEIPPKLQINAREQLKHNLKNFFEENNIKVNDNIKTFSTPNRLIVTINKLPNYIINKAEEIRGPNINSAQQN